MSTHLTYVEDLDDAYRLFLDSVQALPKEKHTELQLDTGLNLAQTVTHIIGWTEHALEILPRMLSGIDTALPPANKAAREHATLDRYQQASLPELLEILQTKRRQLIAALKEVSGPDLTLRRTHGERIYTIKSYLIDLTRDHIIENMEEIRLKAAHNKTTLQPPPANQS